MWDFFRSETRTARKTYRCEEAGCEIQPGDRYAYNSGKLEGDMSVYRLCLECDLISREMVRTFGYDDGYPLGECRHLLRSEHGVEGDAYAWAIEQSVRRRQRAAEHQARELLLGRAEAVMGEVFGERRRQIEVEAWSPEHDDLHVDGDLALAAACYAAPTAVTWGVWPLGLTRQLRWPWSRSWWKPKGRRRDLVRAAALIVAEIERLDRAPSA